MFVSTAGALVGCATSPPVTVPPVIGRTLDDAEAILQRAGLRVGQIRLDSTGRTLSDLVVEQIPSAGATVKQNTPVSLVVEEKDSPPPSKPPVGPPSPEAQSKPPGVQLPSSPILASGYEYLPRAGQEELGCGLYSYVLFPSFSVRAALFLEVLFATIGYRQDSLINLRYLNVIHLPTQAHKMQAVIDRTRTSSPRYALRLGIEFAEKFYDYAFAQKLLVQICLMPAEVIRDLCATALSGGPYLLTYGRPMSTLSPVPPPYLGLDLSGVHVRAFRDFITAYQEQVKRPNYPDRERIETLRLRVLHMILTAADWITPTTSAIANILHMTPGEGDMKE